MNIDPSECRTCSDLANQLAAANARCADYENGISWGTSCISCAKTLDSSYAEYVRAERLQATLDRVSEVYGFLMRKYADPDADAATVLAVTRTSLRAALTPEGTE